MPLLPSLTRMLLIACLILNGSVHALASGNGAVMNHANAGEKTEVVAHVMERMHAGSAPPCHDGAVPTEAGDDMAGAPDGTPGDRPDCCQSGSCTDACHSQLAQIGDGVAFLPAAILNHPHARRPLTSAHESPGLHRLIRPPIA